MRSSDLAAAAADFALAVTRNPFPEIAALALALFAGGLHFLGAGGDLPPILLVAALAVAAVGLGARAAADRPVGPAARLGGVAVALAAGVVGAVLAIGTIAPGHPEAEVDVAANSTARLPVAPGAHRVLVSGRLVADRSSEDVHYDVALGDAHARGEIARVWGRGRLGRGRSVPVANEHTANFHDLSLSAAPEVTVRLDGPLAGPVHVAAYPSLPPVVVHVLAGAAFLGALILDERLKAGLKLAVAGGAAVVFGELMRGYASPGGAAFGPTFGSAAIGAVIAAILVWLLSKPVHRLFGKEEPVPVPAAATRRK
jgi:hypothetical protein